MSWLEKFIPGNSKPNAANVANVNPPNNPNSNQADQPNQAAPPSSNASPPAKADDPLAVFAKMYDNPANAEAAPTFNLDSEQLSKVAKTQNFMAGIDPALIEKATNGDTKALLEIINASNQNAYSSALAHTSKLTDTFVSAREAHNAKGFGSRVKNELVNAELGSTLNFSNPVVKKQLTRTAEELQRQNPDASPQEIKQLAIQYITELASAINPTASPSANKKNQDTDFDAWFNS